MARSKTIREDVNLYMDVLLDLYEESDPDLGRESSHNKIVMARHAIEVWWRLHGKLMAWAQNHMVGYSIFMENGEFNDWFHEKIGRPINEDSHELEYIGWQYCWLNMPETKNETWKEVRDLLEFMSDNELPQPVSEAFSNNAFRLFIFESLMSRSPDNSFWRMELQHAMRALNYGETRPLVQPDPKKTQGRAYSLRMAKARAVSQVYFRLGKGIKKYRALEKVGEGIGQSPETIRAWEKDLLTDPDLQFEFWCSELAGAYCDELEAEHWTKIPAHEEMGQMRGVYMIENAAFLVRRLKKNDLTAIREDIRTAREKP